MYIKPNKLGKQKFICQKPATRTNPCPTPDLPLTALSLYHDLHYYLLHSLKIIINDIAKE